MERWARMTGVFISELQKRFKTIEFRTIHVECPERDDG